MGGGRILVEVAVDDLVLFASFEHRGEGQDRQRKPAIARPGGARIEENDHLLTSVPHRCGIAKVRDDRLSFARSGRRAQRIP